MVKICADSTCDLSPETLEEYDITMAPLYIMVGEEAHRDGVDITPEEIFRYVDKEGKSCRTTAMNVFDYQELFGKYAKEYEAVIQICIGAGFSSCFQNASIAAADFDNVYVVDSQNLSNGSGLLVYEAARMAKAGACAQEIINTLELMIPKVEASFVIDRLDYLRKGGRCSALTAQSAKLLNIRPCIEVTGGKMTVGKKYHGGFEECLKKYVRDRLEGRTDIECKRVFITQAVCDPGIVQSVRDTVKKYAGFEEVLETRSGCTVSTHCGPNTLGVMFMRK
jgi:DegV family protein with EDD domain